MNMVIHQVAKEGLRVNLLPGLLDAMPTTEITYICTYTLKPLMLTGTNYSDLDSQRFS